MNPIERYRLEKTKRGLPLQSYGRDGKQDLRGRTTRLACPECRDPDHVVLGRIYRLGRPTQRRKAWCSGCGYRWVTISREAFGTRQVEVRG